jgi:UDP-N-acetylglucosamine--dolichyl-phosphate N-acetylglucosaminephosphotransferase
MIALLIAMAIAFLTTFIATPIAMKFLYTIGIVGLDLHKKNKPKLPASGGVCVASGLIVGLLVYIGIQTFFYNTKIEALNLLAAISSILIVTGVGIADDLNIRSKLVKTKEGLDIKIGLPQSKWLLTLPAAVPLMVISIGNTTMSIPFIGSINFGLIYPLLLIPLGFVGASNVVNLLGGFNGSEAGMGAVYMLSLGLYALLHGNSASIIFLTSFAAILAFLFYNKYPSRILPGDSLTYLLGSTVAAGVIIGGMEKIGMIVLIPFFIEFFLKAKSRFRASCLGKLEKNGKLRPPYERKIYSITHVLMNLKPMSEREVTISLILIEIFFSLIPFLGLV